MKRRNFLGLLAAIVPASWLPKPEVQPEPKVNSDEFCGCMVAKPEMWKVTITAGAATDCGPYECCWVEL